MRMIFYAPNVHTGGGAVLAHAFLAAAAEMKIEATVFLDARYPQKIPTRFTHHSIRPTLAARLGAEFTLQKLSAEHDVIFSFGNLPPLLAPACPSIVYFHNKNLLPDSDISQFPWPSRTRQHIERWWLRLFGKNTDLFLLQTPGIQEEFLRTFHYLRTELLPFVPDEVLKVKARTSPPAYDYLYVAASAAHKNHQRLLDAWELLAQSGMTPSLALTVESSARPLLARIAELQKNPQIKIFNLPDLPYTQVLQLYLQSRCFIFPSLQESFGIPLIEAANSSLPIVASQLKYVEDVIEPSATFDAGSAESIADTVRKVDAIYAAGSSLKAAQVKKDILNPREAAQRLLHLAASLRGKI